MTGEGYLYWSPLVWNLNFTKQEASTTIWNSHWFISLYLYYFVLYTEISLPVVILRADFRFVPSQWETSLQNNTISHWLGTNLESALIHPSRDPCILYCLHHGCFVKSGPCFFYIHRTNDWAMDYRFLAERRSYNNQSAVVTTYKLRTNFSYKFLWYSICGNHTFVLCTTLATDCPTKMDVIIVSHNTWHRESTVLMYRKTLI